MALAVLSINNIFFTEEKINKMGKSAANIAK
jgi:hypothetical protein